MNLTKSLVLRNTLVMALVFLGAGAPEAAAKPALDLFQEAEVHFSMARFKRSLRLLKRAKRRAKDPQLKAKVSLLLGINLAVLKRERPARREFRLALKADPSLVVDDREVKPSIIVLFEEVRQSLKGTVRVVDYQEGSRIQVDGEDAGTVPAELQLPVGSHRIELTTPDNNWRSQGTVMVTFGETQTFKEGMERIMLAPPPTPASAPAPSSAAVVEAAAAQDAQPPAWRLYGGLAALGVGAGLVATGVVFGMKVKSANDDYGAGKDELTYAELQTIADDADRYETIQWVTLVSGGVVLAAGGGLLLWHLLQAGDSAREESLAVVPFLGASSWGLAGQARF